MSDEEKKNGEYQKPESHKIGEDDLEDVSAGWNPPEWQDHPQCMAGQVAYFCNTGGQAHTIP